MIGRRAQYGCCEWLGGLTDVMLHVQVRSGSARAEVLMKACSGIHAAVPACTAKSIVIHHEVMSILQSGECFTAVSMVSLDAQQYSKLSSLDLYLSCKTDLHLRPFCTSRMDRLMLTEPILGQAGQRMPECPSKAPCNTPFQNCRTILLQVRREA